MKYSCDQDTLDLILEYQKQYSNCLHYNYNRILDNQDLTESDLREQSKNINNCPLIKSWLMQCSIKEAKSLIKISDKLILFGSKKLFLKRLKNHISKEKFKLKCFNPVNIIGEELKHSNHMVQIDKTLDTLQFFLVKIYDKKNFLL